MDRGSGTGNQHELHSEFKTETAVFGQYLSDEIPPMLAADAIERLTVAPSAVAVTIQTWVSNQYSGPNPLPVSDYLFHAAKKLHLLVEFELLDQERLRELLVSLYPMLLEICPEADRIGLATNLRTIGHEQSLMTSVVERVHRPMGSGAEGHRATAPGENPGASSATGTPPGGASTPAQPPEVTNRLAEGLERLNVLLDRIDVPISGPREAAQDPNQNQALLAEIVGELTASSTSEVQLHNQLSLVGNLGIGGSGSELLQLLSRSLPDWVQPTGGDTVAAPVKTMERVVGLASTSGETRERYFEFVDVAVREFNSGALGRAATLFRSAEQMIESGEVDASVARGVKGQIYSRIDQEMLRKELESEENSRALRHVLAFFPQVAVGELLLELEVEQQRDRRRFIISMLRAHGPTARLASLDALADSKAGRRSLPWYVERNLIHLLRSVPRTEGEEVSATEIEVLTHYSQIEGEFAVVRETLRLLGTTPGSKAEALSAARVGETEQALLGTRETRQSVEDLQSLLDQLLRDLGRRTTPTAWRCVVGHALKRKPALGQTLKRITELGRHSLKDEPAVLDPLLDCLRSDLPLKLFSVTVAGKNRIDNVKRLISALSGTDTPPVRELFTEIADRFHGKELAGVAERALRRLASDEDPSDLDDPLPTLAGDIGLFGLPNLLQNLSDSNLTGELIIRCENDGPTATVHLVEGQLSDASFDTLEGETALYQLLERPLEGQFSFMSRRTGESKDGMDLVSILLEGMRRYDELTRAEALVPDEARLSGTGLKPTLPSPQVDRQLAKAVWEAVNKGVKALECERVADVDCYQVRTLLSHWLGQGALKPVTTSSEQQ